MMSHPAANDRSLRLRPHAASRRIRARDRREGAAMLMVLMVLLMTTATATFAIHSTTMEMRSAGYSRQAMQTGYVAEGGVYSGLSYIDAVGAQVAYAQYMRTPVAAGVQYAPGVPTVDHATNVLRIANADFAAMTGAVTGPPIETEAARVPSLGPRDAYVPSFLLSGTDIFRVYRPVAGRDLGGGGELQYMRVTMTARASLAPPSDFRSSGDPRDFHEMVANARAVAEMGPLGL